MTPNPYSFLQRRLRWSAVLFTASLPLASTLAAQAMAAQPLAAQGPGGDTGAVATPDVPAELATALQRASLLVEQEGNLREALTIYERLVGAAANPAQVRAEAALEAGTILLRIGREAQAEEFLALAVALQPALAAEVDATRTRLQSMGGDTALNERAKELVAALDDEVTTPPQGARVFPGILHQEAAAELVWIGPAAVPAILARLEQSPRGPKVISIRNGLMGLVWHIGGDDAARYLRVVAASGDLELRRDAASGAYLASKQMAADVAPLFLADADPEGLVVRRVLLRPFLGYRDAGDGDLFLRAQPAGGRTGERATALSSQLPLARVVELVSHPVAGVRTDALFVLAVWQRFTHEQPQDAMFRELQPRLEAALDADDSAVREAGWALLGRLWLLSKESRELMIARVGDWPVTLGGGIGGIDPLTTPLLSEHLESLRDLLQRMGPRTGNNAGRRKREESVDVMLTWLVRNTPIASPSADELALLLDICRLGYGGQAILARLRSYMEGWLTPENAGPVFQAMEWLDLHSADAFLEAGKHLYFKKGLQLDAPTLESLPDQVLRWAEHDDKNAAQQVVTSGIRLLIYAAHPRSLELLQQVPALIERRGLSLRLDLLLGFASERLVGTSQAAGVLDMQLAHSGYIGPEPYLKAGSEAFVERFEAVIRSHVVRKGLIYISPEGDTPNGWDLLCFPRGSRQDGQTSGFTDEQLQDLWRRLFAESSPLWDGDGIAGLSRNGPNGFPPGFLASMLANLDPNCERFRAKDGNDNTQGVDAVVEWLGRDPDFWLRFPNWDAPDPRYREVLDSYRDRVLSQGTDNRVLNAAVRGASGEQFLAHWPALKERLIPAIRSHPGMGFTLLGRIHAVDPAAARDVLRFQLSAVEPVGSGIRQTWLITIGLNSAGAAGIVLPLEDWRFCFRDPDWQVRVAACRYAARLKDGDPPLEMLLEALKDGSQEVQEAASDALDLIRQYREEKAYWGNADRERKLPTAEQAAEELLVMAQDPDATLQVRMSAVRGLGALGRPEVIPFLIRLANDKDAGEDLQRVASAALRVLYARMEQAEPPVGQPK